MAAPTLPKEAAPLTIMNGHMEGPQLLLEAAFSSRLLHYKYPAPVSPLECALPQFPATVHSKQLTGSAKSFRMRSYTKTGGRGPHSFPPSCPPFTPKETHSSSLPYILPSSVCSKPFVSHSYENCRGCTLFFPNWNSLAKRLKE